MVEEGSNPSAGLAGLNPARDFFVKFMISTRTIPERIQTTMKELCNDCKKEKAASLSLG